MSRRREEALRVLEQLRLETAERLRAAQAAVVAAERAVVDAKTVRAGVIGEAADEGWSQAAIGAELGVSKQRVAQLRQADAEANAA